jgi:hypothetical protein
MAKVKILVGLAGHTFSVSPGEPFECSDAEAKRLVDAGAAEPWKDGPSEKAVRKGPAETR